MLHRPQISSAAGRFCRKTSLFRTIHSIAKRPHHEGQRAKNQVSAAVAAVRGHRAHAVGIYHDSEGAEYGWLMTIPEPTTALLLTLAGLGMGKGRRRNEAETLVAQKQRLIGCFRRNRERGFTGPSRKPWTALAARSRSFTKRTSTWARVLAEKEPRRRRALIAKRFRWYADSVWRIA